MRYPTGRGWLAGAATIAAGGVGAWLVARARADAPPPTYPPLDVPKPFAENVWIVDGGPLRAAGIPLPVRMTVMRLANGDLLLHSPTRYTPALAEALGKLGRVRHLIAPNVAHWTFAADWQRAFPDATMWAVPGLGERRQVRASPLRIDAELGDTAPEAWGDEIAQGVVSGAAGFREMWFFHCAGRTLVLVDLIQNLDPERLPPVARLALEAMGATRGTTTRYLRPVVRLGGGAAKRAVAEIVALAPERVVFAHGRPFESDGAARLRAAFGWFATAG